MITKSLKPLIFCILALTTVLFITQFFRNELAFQRADIDLGQWWLLISGNFVHSNYPHLLLNLAGLWIFGFVYYDNISVKTFTISTLFLSTAVGLGLYLFNPELHKYYGFSGVLYGLFLVGATTSFLAKDYFTGWLITLFITGKIILDLIYGGSTSSTELIGIPVAVHAHLYGAIGAIFINLGLYLKQKRKK